MNQEKVYINSVHRKTPSSSDASQATYVLDPYIEGSSLSIDRVIMWNLFKPFASYNNKIRLSYNDGSAKTTGIISIDTTKFYDTAELITELTNKINADVAGLCTSITFDTQTRKLTFTFANDAQFITTGIVNEHAYYKLGVFYNVGEAESTTVVANSLLNYNTKQVYIEFDNVTSTKNTNNSLRGAVLCVPLVEEPGDIIVTEPNNPFSIELPGTPMTNLRVSIKNSNGKLKEYPGNYTIEATLYK